MNPELPEICAILRQERIRLTLLSTGLLLKKCSGEVAASFDDVIVSLDGPRSIHDKIRRVEGAFDLLQGGVLALRKLRPDMPITARSTVQKVNHRYLVETARSADQMQLDGISFLAVDVSSTAFNRPLVWPTELQAEVRLSIQELSALENAIEELIYCAENEFRAGFVAEPPQKLRRIVHHFRAQLGLEPWESPTCNAPWVSAVLEVDGSVRPCFFHPAIGNLQNSTLKKVINSETALDFRSHLDIPSNSVCEKCVCSLNYRP